MFVQLGNRNVNGYIEWNEMNGKMNEKLSVKTALLFQLVSEK